MDYEELAKLQPEAIYECAHGITYKVGCVDCFSCGKPRIRNEFTADNKRRYNELRKQLTDEGA